MSWGYSHLDKPKSNGVETRKRIRQRLPRPPFAGLTTFEIAALVGRHESTVRYHLRRMVRDGEAERITEGPGHSVFYRLPPSVAQLKDAQHQSTPVKGAK